MHRRTRAPASAQQLRPPAQRLTQSLGWFGNKNEEAAELLEKASNYFKLGKVGRLEARAGSVHSLQAVLGPRWGLGWRRQGSC